MKNSGLSTKQILITLVLLVAVGIVGLIGYGYWSSQHYDSFSGMSRVFLLDKESYVVGDSIKLALELQGESEVRFYENLEYTISVWLCFRVPYQIGTVVTSEGITEETIQKRNPGNIRTYQLNKDQPLLFDFYGDLRESENKVAFVITFPDLNAQFTVPKKEYSDALALEIHGRLRSINPSPVDALEDYIENVRLVIEPKP